MREHKPRKHRRSVTPESSAGDDDQPKMKKAKHHHHHHHSHHQNKKQDSKSPKTEVIQSRSSGDQGQERKRSDREKDRSNITDVGKDRYRDRENERSRDEGRVKIKEEPLDDRNRVQPSSSKWDDDDDRKRAETESGNLGRPFKRERDKNDPRWREGGSGSSGRGGRGGPRRNQKRPFFKRGEEDTSHMEWGKRTENGDSKQLPPQDKDKPNFGLSGKLTEDTNTYNGVVIKYSEPPEARKPKRRWRLYPFKGDEALSTLHIHRQSAFLMGRDRKVVDIPIDHPSCSKQHAALQYRLVTYQRDDGSTGKRVRPYIIDLDSANGTYVNNNRIEPRKYVELLERDVIKFGYSSREYVLLHEHSKDDEDDDNL